MTIKIKYTGDEQVMQLHRIDSRWPDAVDVERCAIGRSSPWPTKMTDATWSNLKAISGDYHEKIRKGII